MRLKLNWAPLALSLALSLAASAPALAQHHEEAGSDNAALFADLAENLESTGKKIIDLAEAIPADKYGWAPSEEVRTVGEVFMHVVGVNKLLPSALGAPLPEGMEPPENAFAAMRKLEVTVTAKAAILKELRESFVYVAKAVTEVDDLETKVALFGPPQSKRAYLLIILGHAHEHLGQAIAYARSIGVVPPWSGNEDG